MLKTMWEKLKKNYAVLIAIATTFVTIVYAAIKFIIYTYWSGYFKRLNIDNNFIKLDYDGVIYQAVFVFIMLLAVLYVMCTLETLYKDKWFKFKEKKDKKFFRFLRMIVGDVFVTAILFCIANFPWIIFICAWGNLEMNLAAIFTIVFLLSIFETGFVIYHLIFEKKANNKNLSWENKVAVGILSVLIFSSLILAIVYFSGSRAIENIHQVRLVESERYMITYSDGEKYVLHKVVIDEKEVTIKRNEQKVISNKNVEFIIKNVNLVKVVN